MPRKSRDISRTKAQAYALEYFGPRAFARKKTKTKLGARREVGIRGTVPPFRVKVVGAGRSWREAFAVAINNLGIKVPEKQETPVVQATGSL